MAGSSETRALGLWTAGQPHAIVASVRGLCVCVCVQWVRTVETSRPAEVSLRSRVHDASMRERERERTEREWPAKLRLTLWVWLGAWSLSELGGDGGGSQCLTLEPRLRRGERLSARLHTHTYRVATPHNTSEMDRSFAQHTYYTTAACTPYTYPHAST